MKARIPRPRMTRWLRAGALLVMIAPLAGTLLAQEVTVELDPAKTRIDYTVGATLHTVHGTFALKNGTIHFNPATGSASGLVVVDATSGASGNKGRDHKMHEEVLESQRYPEITFTPTKMSGRLNFPGSSSVQVDGIFRLHGTDHPIASTLQVQVQGQSLSARTHIVIPYMDWGLKNPSTFILHVSESVDINITAEGSLHR
ncbi:MAG: YceI family protein [Terriglobales bacterium]